MPRPRPIQIGAVEEPRDHLTGTRDVADPTAQPGKRRTQGGGNRVRRQHHQDEDEGRQEKRGETIHGSNHQPVDILPTVAALTRLSKILPQ
jgi:hypothetical protein